jgi:hypothetical protein
MQPTRRARPWLAALKHMHDDAADEQASVDSAIRIVSRTDKTDKSPTDEPTADIAWRVAAFRDALPALGPIWPPRIRNTSLADTPGHCSLCGDQLPTDPTAQPRFPRCAPCVRALWLALHEIREG